MSVLWTVVYVEGKWGEAKKYTVEDVSAEMPRRYLMRRSRKCQHDDACLSRLYALTGLNAVKAHVNLDIWSTVRTSSGRTVRCIPCSMVLIIRITFDFLPPVVATSRILQQMLVGEKRGRSTYFPNVGRAGVPAQTK